MKRINPLSIAAPMALLLLAAAPKMFSDDHDKKTDVTITEPVQVPGAVLQPGKYMFILLNSSSDRHIIEIKSEDGKKLYSMSFATAASRVVRTGDVVLTFYEMPEGAPPAVRQWFWPGDYEGQEFLYSHQDALKISAGSGQKVPELTDQEAAKVADQTYPVTADQTASVQSTQSTQPVEQSSVTTAQQSVQPIPDQGVQSTQTDTQVQAVAQAAPPVDNSNDANPPAQIAQNTPPPAPAPAPVPQDTAANNANTSLPQTGSDMPLIGLLGLVSLVSAATLRFARHRA